jgi:hypothetical protein
MHNSKNALLGKREGLFLQWWDYISVEDEWLGGIGIF